MTDVDAWIDEAELPTSTVPICLKAGLLDEYERVQDQIRKVEANGRTGVRTLASRVSTPPELAALHARAEELQVQARAATKTFTVQALSREDYRDLVKEHPPKKGSADVEIGYDVEAFTHALVTRCVIDPVMTAAQWARLLPRMSAGQQNKLQREVHEINATSPDLPF